MSDQKINTSDKVVLGIFIAIFSFGFGYFVLGPLLLQAVRFFFAQ